MNINNFEQHFNQVILQRGRQYYASGHVVDVAKINESNWQAEVKGTYPYVVDISVDVYNKITYMDCDCPYESDCKHIAAALYAIQEKLASPETKAPKKSSLKQLLQAQTKEQLLKMIIETGENHPAFLQEIELQVTPRENELVVAEQLIVHHIANAKGYRRGFIDWNQTSEAMAGVYITHERIQTYLEEGAYLLALQLAIICLRHAANALQYSDDSSGEVGGAVDDSLAFIEQATLEGASVWTQGECEEAFAIIHLEAKNPDLDGWAEWQLGLLRTCIPLCADDEMEQQFNEALRSFEEASDSWSARYVNKEIKELQLQLILSKHGNEAAEQFLEQNIDDDNMRERVIKLALEQEDYERVLDLTAKGLQHDEKFPGIIKKWKKYAFTAHKELGHNEVLRELARVLLKDGEIDYYTELKELYTGEEWQSERKQLLDELEQANSRIYAQIIVDEQQTERILAYCRASPARIEHYYAYINEHYYEETCALFIDFINKKATQATDRKRYQEVCRTIQTMRKAGYNVESKQLITELLQTYFKRPAFVDELKKIQASK